LRDILGLAKCSTLLSRFLDRQSTASTSDDSTRTPPSHPNTERPPSSLRAEAREWTPSQGPESPGQILRRVLQFATTETPSKYQYEGHLLPPFIDYASRMAPLTQPGTFYVPPFGPPKFIITDDLAGDGKSFVSSLVAKRENPTTIPQKPIAPPGKHPTQPTPQIVPTQTAHSFPMTASLLPQTFSVHLLSTLHMRLQYVCGALELLDASFAAEMAKSVGPLNDPTRWESWMSPSGVAGMTGSLVELRKSLDELCGATARAGCIVDTWNAFQSGRLDSSAQESRLGSAAIDGVEMNGEAEMKMEVQAPIGRPSTSKGRKLSNGSGIEIGERTHEFRPTSSNAPIAPAVPVFRPPPGLTFPIPVHTTADSTNQSVPTNGSKHFPSGSRVRVADSKTSPMVAGPVAGERIQLLRRLGPIGAPPKSHEIKNLAS
jgi:hypothetical protein